MKGLAVSQDAAPAPKRRKSKSKNTYLPSPFPYHRTNGGNIVAPPAEVLAERDNALAQPRTLISILQGDPVPSRSALARQMWTAKIDGEVVR
jgi:hypothetical protein